MSIRVEVGEPSSEVTATAADHASLDAWRDELADLAETGEAVSIDLRRTGAGWSTIEAIEVIRALFAAASGDVVLYVGTERVAAFAREVFGTSVTNQPTRYPLGPIVVALRDVDIVSVRADALVNASNQQLRLGSGVSGALREACGPELQRALDRLAPIASDGLVETPSFALTSTRRILHVPTVSGSEVAVGRAYQNILRHCQGRYASVAVPALGCGAGGLPFEISAELLARAALAAAPLPLEVIVALRGGRGRAALDAVFAAHAKG